MELPRYDRQLRLEGVGEEGQRKLQAARVLLVGVGGLGSPASLYLTGAGVGTLGIIDDDVVSETNLHRQVLYSEDQIGTLKVEQAARRLRALNSEVAIETYAERLTRENAEEIISRYDLVVDGSDNFATRYLISDTTERLGKPYVYGAIYHYTGQVSVFNLPDGVSYRQLFPNEERLVNSPRPDNALLGMLPGVVGATEAMEAVKLITGCGKPLSRRLWVIDLQNNTTTTINL